MLAGQHVPNNVVFHWLVTVWELRFLNCWFQGSYTAGNRHSTLGMQRAWHMHIDKHWYSLIFVDIHWYSCVIDWYRSISSHHNEVYGMLWQSMATLAEGLDDPGPCWPDCLPGARQLWMCVAMTPCEAWRPKRKKHCKGRARITQSSPLWQVVSHLRPIMPRAASSLKL